MAPENGKPESIAATVTEVSERMTTLVREEIELAKAEVTQKAASIARGTAAVAAGAIFGVFAIVFVLNTLAWGLDAILVDGAGDIWIGFAIVTGVLVVLAVLAFLFAWRKLRVGTPRPQMAIDEARKIRGTVSAGSESAPTGSEAISAGSESAG
jgi:uncharacterized small protein (DUF1192 family)